MAYNVSGFNPDALPAHAEPEQAAQLLSSQQPPQQPPQQQQPPPVEPRRSSHPSPNPQQRPYSHSNPAPPNSSLQQYQNKPPPPLPGQPGPHYPPQKRPSGPQIPPNNRIQSPQPPQRFGYSPPAPQQARPPPHTGTPRPPPTPAPPNPSNSSDASLFPLFKAVDKNGTGQLTERELGKALVNGDFTSFDQHTVRMMIRMFDADKSGSVNFDEFCGLWSFLAAWRALFDRFDEDGSGYISFTEYTNALVAFGYRLSSNFVQMLYTTYDKAGEGQMSFDLFVQSCIILKRMTDVFKRYDEDRDGYITLSFEEFLTEILKQR